MVELKNADRADLTTYAISELESNSLLDHVHRILHSSVANQEMRAVCHQIIVCFSVVPFDSRPMLVSCLRQDTESKKKLQEFLYHEHGLSLFSQLLLRTTQQEYHSANTILNVTFFSTYQ